VSEPGPGDDTTADGERDPLERLAEEFAGRCRRGEPASVSEYEARYPEHAEGLRKLLPTVALMEQLKRGGPQARRGDPGRAAPERMGEFRVLRELGRGGMGVVYEAVQESLGRHVALKVIHHVHLDARRLQRFQREAQAVAQLHHTNIVPIFGVGEHEGLPYYVMQYIKGSGLDARVAEWRRQGGPSGGDRRRFVARVGVQAAEALQHAHDQGVLHRDVKPANLRIDEHETVWVTDFGLAKLTGHDDLTASGDVIGTLRYLAPEALRGETDRRSDVYSLGLTLYELLTLRPPFGELSPSELLRHVSEGQPVRPRRLDPAIPRDLETVVLKAIAREPRDRYPTSGALADDLRRFLEDRPIRARRATPVERVWRWARRNRATAALTATAAGSLLLAAAVGWIGYASTTRALKRADENVALSLEVFEELFGKLAPPDNSLPPPTGPSGHRRPPLDPDDAPPSGLRTAPRDANPFEPVPRPPGERPGPPRRGGPANGTALLQSVLTFYERFAERNEANPRLQSEAARAYFRVGTLYERLGRGREAARAKARAVEMLEGLVARFPRVPEYRARLVEVDIRADPWSADPASLEGLEGRLSRARGLVDGLAREAPDDLDHLQSQVHVHAKLGVVFQRLGRADDAEACFRRAVDLAGSLIERSPGKIRPVIDRVDTREALARLQLDRGRRDEARTLVEAAARELRALARTATLIPPVVDRFESLAEDFRKLGDTGSAAEMSRRARGRSSPERPGRGGPTEAVEPN